MTHTPGPWTVASSGLSVNAGPFGKIRQEHSLPANELRANMHLIAAAPLMLDKLRELRESCAECEGKDDACSDCADIREVIELAEGVPAAKSDTIESLTAEYRTWNADQGLDLGSADEHLSDSSLTVQQRRWLKNFVRRWEAV